MLNDPFAGGTHLPDITMVLAVFVPAEPDARVSTSPSAPTTPMSAACTPAPWALPRDLPGRLPHPAGAARRRRRHGSPASSHSSCTTCAPRTSAKATSTAQIGACRVGELRLHELVERYGPAPRPAPRPPTCIDYSERLMRAAAPRRARRHVRSRRLPRRRRRHRRAPFASASPSPSTPTPAPPPSISPAPAPQVASSINAVYAITYSAVYYVFRCLLPEDAPATAGLMRPVARPRSRAAASSTPCSPPPSPAATSKPRSASSMCSCALSPKRCPSASPPPAPAP